MTSIQTVLNRAMKVCVLLILPILITSKKFLIETKDSMEAKGGDVTEDDTGMDFVNSKLDNIKKYRRHCTEKGKSFGLGEGKYCKRWLSKW